jgi:uridine phosphorylase
LQENIEVDTLLASSYGLGFDNLAHFYSETEVIDEEMSRSYTKHTNWPKKLSSPYIIKASENLFSLFVDLPSGITATAPGFYGPQARTLRLNPAINNLHSKMESFTCNNNQIANFEMETSALYYLGQTLGHNTLTI